MNYKGIKDQIHTCKNCLEKFTFKGYSSLNIFCSIECDKKFKAKQSEILFENRYNDWLAGKDIEIKNLRRLIKRFLIKRDGYKCSRCLLSKWLDKDITLWCDHIDGNATNNKPDNFRLICPNCDSQSPTFGGKNRGYGRKSRGLPQYG